MNVQTRTAPRRRPAGRPRRPRRRLIAMAVAVAMAVTGLVIVLVNRDQSLAGTTVTASSTALNASAGAAADTGSAADPGNSWKSNGETVGAWVELSWPATHTMHQVSIVRDALEEPGVTAGYLTFGDGSRLQLTLSTASAETLVPISPRSADRVRFTASAVSPGARSVTIAEITVLTRPGELVVEDAPDGNTAPGASVTQSGSSSDPQALQDGSGTPDASGTGADWIVERPEAAWVQFDWKQARELAGIVVVGSARSGSHVSGATVTFADGSRLPIGAVLADPTRPTTVTFMPRVTTSVRLTIDQVTGPGSLALGEVRLYQRGSTPIREAASTTPSPPLLRSGPCASPPPAGPPIEQFEVRCPVTGSVVQGATTFQLRVPPGYSTVVATVWPAEEAVAASGTATATPDSLGAAELVMDLGGVPYGPLTIRFVASGAGLDTQTVFFQLYRDGADPVADVPSGAPAHGRTLVYAEEFDRPLSLSRSGDGADYAAAKPTYSGVEDFGTAPFADPDRHTDAIRVVDDRYLRIDVGPAPSGGTGSTGGLLASARPGGSGFSAQYGYFEARMLMPAAAGTWPAFWMLPSDNLVSKQRVVAEIDAVESYGHEPRSACHSTHDYGSGDDGGKSSCGQRFTDDRGALSWHTYGVSIEPAGNTFYIDGRVVATAPQVAGGGSPMFFMVDLALGGGWPVDLRGVQGRAALYVDYVRVFV